MSNSTITDRRSLGNSLGYAPNTIKNDKPQPTTASLDYVPSFHNIFKWRRIHESWSCNTYYYPSSSPSDPNFIPFFLDVQNTRPRGSFSSVSRSSSQSIFLIDSSCLPMHKYGRIKPRFCDSIPRNQSTCQDAINSGSPTQQSQFYGLLRNQTKCIVCRLPVLFGGSTCAL